jgi:methyl-accepting chemotaxis protein
MSERKTQSRSIPVRVRMWPSNVREHTSLERETDNNTIVPVSPATSESDIITDSENIQDFSFSHVLEKEKRTQQVKELLRLCGLLRADLSLDEVLQQIANSTAACTGFRALSINLLDPSGKLFISAATFGVSGEDEKTLRSMRLAIESVTSVMLPEFSISQSYFIPHGYESRVAIRAVVSIKENASTLYGTGKWHPRDMLLVPLYNPRQEGLLGFLSLDDPENGKVPTEEMIEVIELFANKAAIAIDNAHIFQEREEERIALEEGIASLSADISLLAQGDMRPRITSKHTRLQPIAEAINTTVDKVGVILFDMVDMTRAVDEHMQHMQQNTELLANDTRQQEIQVDQISRTINEFAQMMNVISERAAHLSRTAVDGAEVSNEAQGAIDRTAEGMGIVREATLQSARTMKNLSESGHEINETVAVINDLTMRMHLLALNAAIEATRAGEHKSGLTAIAQEIRLLAVNSTDAAHKVSEYIHTIQQETTKASQSVEQSTQEVVKQTELVMQTGVAIDAISAVTDQLTHLIEGIVMTAGSQSQVSQLVVTAITEILRMTGDVTRHMREMQRSTNRLVELSNALRSRLSLIQLREP